jgi:hypothetical protein
MILHNMYNEVLIEPVRLYKANKLYIVSGYASATFANQHLKAINEIIKENNDFQLNLIIGMAVKRTDHPGFLRLKRMYANNFNCYYIENSPFVHCKLYSWFKNGNPILGFAGSANYSQPGFFGIDQINQLSNENPKEIRNFYEKLVTRSVEITEYTRFNIEEIREKIISVPEKDVEPGNIRWDIEGKRVTISFLDRNGKLPERSGLNWGQRPEEGREPNQAYLSIKKDARDEGFLPPIAYTFTLITDDNQSFDCVVAQGGRKAIHSTNDNSEIGRYIRNRLGVPLGEKVKREDLERYGRTDFTLEKINDETFLFDFSIKIKELR